MRHPPSGGTRTDRHGRLRTQQARPGPDDDVDGPRRPGPGEAVHCQPHAAGPVSQPRVRRLTAGDGSRPPPRSRRPLRRLSVVDHRSVERTIPPSRDRRKRTRGHGEHRPLPGRTPCPRRGHDRRGKSLLLQTWLLGLALEHPPDQVAFILIDFKGGATFAPLEAPPHTDSVLDDFDSAAAFRALVSVRAEITRRERLLAAHGRASIDDLADPPPRLVVVIDEFHALMSTHPRAADLLEHLTALGRSLGVHLILATQRPLGIVTGQMKANINIRICLRVRDDADSLDVIGVPDAAHLPPGCPGTTAARCRILSHPFPRGCPFAEAVADPGPHRLRLRPWSPGATPGRPPAMSGDIGRPPRRRPPSCLTDDGGEAGSSGAPASARDRWSRRSSGKPRRVAAQAGTSWHRDRRSRESSTFPPNRVSTYGPLIHTSTARSPSSGIPAPTSPRSRTDGGQCLGYPSHRRPRSHRRDHRLGGDPMRDGLRMAAPCRHRSPFPDDRGASRPEPTLVVCDHWSELVDSLDHRTAGALERLLAHAAGFGLTFLLAGCRSAFAEHVDLPDE
ncbi:hypothetical protein IOD13_11630 [Brevibacterium casei]|nr:hypothetical protein [Brevibacterium casei]